MARIRTIKPAFFRHEALYEAERETGMPLRVAFAGLWTAADKEGRFKWAPRALKLDCLPYDDVDFSRVLDALVTRGYIVKYHVAGHDYGFIPSWKDHQAINNRESASQIPEPNENNKLTREARVADATVTPLFTAQGEGKGREGKGNEESAAPSARADSDEAQCFARGKKLFGEKSGGFVVNLVKAKGGNYSLALAALATASTKSNPREYIGAIIKGADPPDDARARGDAW